MSGPRSGGPDAETGAGQWMVQGEAVENGAVAAFVVGRDDIELLRHTAPDILLLKMSQLQVDLLRERFGEALLIVRDRPIPLPLQPFDL